MGRGSGVGAAQRDVRHSKWEGGQGCVGLRLSRWVGRVGRHRGDRPDPVFPLGLRRLLRYHRRVH